MQVSEGGEKAAFHQQFAQCPALTLADLVPWREVLFRSDDARALLGVGEAPASLNAELPGVSAVVVCP